MQLIGTIRGIGRPRLPRRAIWLADLVVPREGHDRFFLPSTYRERDEPVYYSDAPPAEVVYQPDVYSLARRIAFKSNSPRLIDVGCGNGEKLVTSGAGLETIGIDYGGNLAAARELDPSAIWIEHDLSSPEQLPLGPSDIDEAVIICADVVEHLVDPDGLLTGLAATLPTAAAILISTPDRDRLSGAVRAGPPANESHVREWTRGEFAFLLRAYGFDSGVASFTRPHTGTLARSTTLAVLVPARNADLLRRSTWTWR